jgi:hypothetical protein
MAGWVITVIAKELKVAFKWIAATECCKCSRIVIGHGVVHTADQGYPVHYLRCVRHELTYASARHAGFNGVKLAADLGRRVWLHIKCVDMAGAAVLEDQDARTNW